MAATISIPTSTTATSTSLTVSTGSSNTFVTTGNNGITGINTTLNNKSTNISMGTSGVLQVVNRSDIVKLNINVFDEEIEIRTEKIDNTDLFKPTKYNLFIDNKFKLKIENIHNMDSFLEDLNKKKKNKLRSYDSQLKKLFSIYYLVKYIKENDKNDLDRVIINGSLNTVSIQMHHSRTGFYIYLGTNGNNKISTMYDFVTKYYPSKADIKHIFKNKLIIIDFIEEALKNSNIFSQKMYSLCKRKQSTK